MSRDTLIRFMRVINPCGQEDIIKSRIYRNMHEAGWTLRLWKILHAVDIYDDA